MTDNDIVKAYEGMTPNEQLNLYRNLYYKDGCATEQGIIANAINDILPEYTRQKAEIERLQNDILDVTATIGELETRKDIIRAKAIKEFAEKTDKMITEIYNRHTLDSYGLGDEEKEEIMEFCFDITNGLYNLVKEMTEEQHDQNKHITRASVLDEAKHIVTHDRNEQYGKPEDSFTAIAAIWNAQLTAFGFGRVEPLTAGEAAQLMCGLKLARAATAVNPRADSFIDLAGYAACAGELVCG